MGECVILMIGVFIPCPASTLSLTMIVFVVLSLEEFMAVHKQGLFQGKK